MPTMKENAYTAAAGGALGYFAGPMLPVAAIARMPPMQLAIGGAFVGFALSFMDVISIGGAF